MPRNNPVPADQAENNEEMETDAENDQEEEYRILNSQIDQLNMVLDILEKKNDDIQAQLAQLLKASRDARQLTQEKP